MTDRRIAPQALVSFAEALLLASGAHSLVASDTAHALVETSRCGVDTHGVALLPKVLDRVKAGRSQLERPARVASGEGKPVATIDAGLTPGQHATALATREAVARAKAFGIGHVVVRQSTHFGAATPFLRTILNERLVGFVGSNSLRSMGAFGLRRANLGNNPFGFAAPASEGEDFLFDFCAAVMSFGRRAEYKRDGKPLPEGTFIVPDARPEGEGGVAEIADTLDEIALPFGDFKGASIAVMIEVLGGLLSGGHVGSATETVRDGEFLGPSHFVLALDPASFCGATFEANARAYFEGIRRGETSVRLPGDRLRQSVRERDERGIPLAPSLLEDLTGRARALGVDVSAISGAASAPMHGAANAPSPKG
jgi:ureidoglycolate dehydrogenase (NAD+)